MQSVLTINAVIWGVLAAMVGSLALYRKYLAHSEMDVIHLRDNQRALVSEQEQFAHRLEAIDRWGKTLTIGVVVYGVLIAAVWMFAAWQASVQTIG